MSKSSIYGIGKISSFSWYEASKKELQPLAEFCKKVGGIYLREGIGSYDVCIVDTKNGLVMIEARVDYYDTKYRYPHTKMEVTFRKYSGNLTGIFTAGTIRENRLPKIVDLDDKICVGVGGLRPNDKEDWCGLFVCIRPSEDRREREGEIRIWSEGVGELRKPVPIKGTDEVYYAGAKSVKVKI